MILGHCMSGLQRPQPIFLSQDSQSMNAAIKPEMNTLFLSHLLGIANPWEFHLDNETTFAILIVKSTCSLLACFAHFRWFLPIIHLSCLINYGFHKNVPHFACNWWRYDHRWTSRFMLSGGSESHPWPLVGRGWDGLLHQKNKKKVLYCDLKAVSYFCHDFLLLQKWTIITGL